MRLESTTGLAQVLVRFLRYNVVGAIGLAVRFGVLTGLVELAGAGYLLATAISVEASVLRNFVWHLRWTWRDRTAGDTRRNSMRRLLNFHLVTGAVALVTNVLVMHLVVEYLGVHYMAATVLAIVCGGSTNFVIGNLFIFASAEEP